MTVPGRIGLNNKIPRDGASLAGWGEGRRCESSSPSFFFSLIKKTKKQTRQSQSCCCCCCCPFVFRRWLNVSFPCEYSTSIFSFRKVYPTFFFLFSPLSLSLESIFSSKIICRRKDGFEIWIIRKKMLKNVVTLSCKNIENSSFFFSISL